MKNPFDPKTQEDKYNFFLQMTEAINEWMLKIYPEFDTNLEKKIKKIENLEREIESHFDKEKKSFQHRKNEALIEFKKDLCKYISKEYPDIDGRLAMAAIDITATLKKMDENQKEVQKSLKKIFHSSSLAEDVYKIRDDFLDFRTQFNKFTKNLKELIK
jgi:methyl-accepting chemotaxis protein